MKVCIEKVCVMSLRIFSTVQALQTNNYHILYFSLILTTVTVVFEAKLTFPQLEIIAYAILYYSVLNQGVSLTEFNVNSELCSLFLHNHRYD